MYLATGALKARALRFDLSLTTAALFGRIFVHNAAASLPLPSPVITAIAIGSTKTVANRDLPTEIAYPHRGGYVRRAAVVGRHCRAGVRRGGGARGGWVRPANYWWPIVGAVAAGAAIGFVTAAAAASWAGAPPASGYCWYYTDPSRQQGFWGACPQ
jgi:hypothetical protein